MKNFSLFIVILFACVSCKLGCKVEKAVNDKLPNLIASQLKCNNLPQIQADIKALLNRTNLCQETEGKTGPIAMIACPILVRAGVRYIGSKIPANWECDSSTFERRLEIVLNVACQMIPF